MADTYAVLYHNEVGESVLVNTLDNRKQAETWAAAMGERTAVRAFARNSYGLMYRNPDGEPVLFAAMEDRTLAENTRDKFGKDFYVTTL